MKGEIVSDSFTLPYQFTVDSALMGVRRRLSHHCQLVQRGIRHLANRHAYQCRTTPSWRYGLTTVDAGCLTRCRESAHCARTWNLTTNYFRGLLDTFAQSVTSKAIIWVPLACLITLYRPGDQPKQLRTLSGSSMDTAGKTLDHGVSTLSNRWNEMPIHGGIGGSSCHRAVPVRTAQGNNTIESYPSPKTYARDQWIYTNIHLNSFDTLSRKLKTKAKTEKWTIGKISDALLLWRV